MYLPGTESLFKTDKIITEASENAAQSLRSFLYFTKSIVSCEIKKAGKIDSRLSSSLRYSLIF